MMSNRSDKVFIDSNMIIFAADFQQANVFEWINELYQNVYIHKEVYNELLFPSVKNTIDGLIAGGKWSLFDPKSATSLSPIEQEIYQQRLTDVKDAFHRMNLQRIAAGKRPKTVSNLGEIATIAACLMINAGIICSNDFDIRTVVVMEDYRISLEDKDELISQDSAEDFCVYCVQQNVVSRKLVRNFYKTIIVEDVNRSRKLTQLNERIDAVEE